jgi:sugar phosphate isomerase/epimerase
MNIGLKIWSKNYISFKKLHELFDKKIINHIELYVVPGTFSAKKLSLLKGLPMHFHASNDCNLVEKDKNYEDTINELRKFKDFFGIKKVIFHPGVIINNEQKDIEKVIVNLNDLTKEFDVILENVPREGYDGTTLLASDPINFKKIIDNVNVEVCLDIGHAITSSVYHKKDPIEYIKKYLEFKPIMFHIADGNVLSKVDCHMDIGKGTFPLKEIIKLLPNNSINILETPKIDFENLLDDLDNIINLKKLI